MKMHKKKDCTHNDNHLLFLPIYFVKCNFIRDMKLCTMWAGPLTVKSLKNSYDFRTNVVQ